MRHPVSSGTGMAKSRSSSDFSSTAFEEVSLFGASLRLTSVMGAGVDAETENWEVCSIRPPSSSTVLIWNPSCRWNRCEMVNVDNLRWAWGREDC